MIDEITKQLLVCLRKDGRAKLSSINRSIKIPTTTLFERMRQFSFYSQKNATFIDWQRCGFGIRITGVAKARNNSRERLQQALFEDKNINSLRRVNNNFDFFFEAVFPGMMQAEAFNEKLRSLSSKTRAFFLVETVREEFLFTEKEHLKLLQ
jgi:DNA-binding Lrp family transcriptional regulator